MRMNPHHDCTDPEVVRDLIRRHPWATIVSTTSSGPVASHYPLLLEEDREEIAVVTHLGRPDEVLHELDGGEMLVIVQGHHGYISPSWYEPGSVRAPTWNFSVAHLYGTPEILGEEENLDVLERLVERFERDVEQPMYLQRDYATPIAKGTVGVRIAVDRFTCKLKLSQDKDAQSQSNILAVLSAPGPYRNAELAEDMRRLGRAGLDSTATDS